MGNGQGRTWKAAVDSRFLQEITWGKERHSQGDLCYLKTEARKA